MYKIYLDFETRSMVDIKKVGTVNYSKDATTEVLCCAVSDDRHHPIILNADELKSYNILCAKAQDKNCLFVAHNAFFERCIWENLLVKRYGYPEIPLNRWRCSMAKASAHGLPKSLEKCAKALELSEQKDETGKRVMLKLSKPRKPTKNNSSLWHENPEDYQTLYEYCKQDVNVERDIEQYLPDLTPFEQEIWELDQFINSNGIRIDSNLCHKAIEISNIYTEKLNLKLSELTNGTITAATQTMALTKYLKDKGFSYDNLQKSTLKKVLADSSAPDDIKNICRIRALAAKTSVKKYEAFLNCMDTTDGRVKDILNYSAASTGRWGGKNIQLQNLPRGTEKNTDIAAEMLLKFSSDDFMKLYPNTLETLSSLIRSVLLPDKGKSLFVADYSAIEARVLSWLAGETKTLEAFKNGQDVYCIEASSIFGRPVTKKDKFERTIGKVAILALGYNGGIGAFGSMAKNYEVDMDEVYSYMAKTFRPEEIISAEHAYEFYVQKVQEPLSRKAGIAADIIKQRWRKGNPHIVQFWQEAEQTFIKAMESPNQYAKGCKCHWLYNTGTEFVYCYLPSTRPIVYHRPKTDYNYDKATITHMTLESQTKQYVRTQTYGGKLTENIAQAVARDVMAYALYNIYKKGKFTPHLTVHDEIITSGDRGLSVNELEKQMCELPNWAVGLPIAAEGWKGQRYKK